MAVDIGKHMDTAQCHLHAYLRSFSTVSHMSVFNTLQLSQLLKTLSTLQSKNKQLHSSHSIQIDTKRVTSLFHYF